MKAQTAISLETLFHRKPKAPPRARIPHVHAMVMVVAFDLLLQRRRANTVIARAR